MKPIDTQLHAVTILLYVIIP